jgi:putative tricarboxylic transport membrane protein
MSSMQHGHANNRGHFWIGVGTVVLGGLLALGATQIGGSAGYGGAGPAFLPWLVALVLVGLGVAQIVSARRHAEPLAEAPEFPPVWKAVAWVSAGVLLNALLIERVGFIPSCALLFAVSARGFRIGADERPSWASVGTDFVIGLVLSAPVFWTFTKVLGLTLPGLVKGGWI